MTHPTTPKGWASSLSIVHSAVLGMERFPVNVVTFAQEYTQQVYKKDPIVTVRGADLPGFEGALCPMPSGKKGWGILYNDAISSRGRMNFTLAHEFGHYLLHRIAHPEGLQCSSEDVARWDSPYGHMENQANEFAANLLMPFDDFRKQISPTSKPDYEAFSSCAERYGVSLIAAILQWLKYTCKRAVLVVSREGYILWSRSSESAYKSGAFFKTANSTVEIPSAALPLKTELLKNGRGTLTHAPGTWFEGEVQEMTVLADRYDFAISLLCLDDIAGYGWNEEDEAILDPQPSHYQSSQTA